MRKFCVLLCLVLGLVGCGDGDHSDTTFLVTVEVASDCARQYIEFDYRGMGWIEPGQTMEIRNVEHGIHRITAHREQNDNGWWEKDIEVPDHSFVTISCDSQELGTQ